MMVVLCPGVEADKNLFEAVRASVASFGIRELALQPTLRETQPLLSELHRSARDRLLVFARSLGRTSGSRHFAPGARDDAAALG